MKQAVVIVGSSRNDGDTASLIKELVMQRPCTVINLTDYRIGHYDYEHTNRSDDYLPLMTQIIDTYDTLIFATPVYWYAMSGVMKVFFDRLTDLITIEKELGRKLKGKNMAVLSISNGNNIGDYFWLPFKETAQYLHMHYLGDLHALSGEKNQTKITDFIKRLENQDSFPGKIG